MFSLINITRDNNKIVHKVNNKTFKKRRTNVFFT